MFLTTRHGKESEPSSSSSSSSLQGSQPCRRFEFPEIQLATENFDESLVIGHGGFGKVYKGNVINGSILVGAAIKRLDTMSNQGATEFWAEVEVLSKLRHCHLVSLIGYCNYGKEMILVYEYMPHGTLEDHLHKLCTPVSWLQRLKICIGAARGLDYLHTGTGIELGVIHRDVKSSNILLHETWAAKISDFGLSRIGPTNQPSTYVNTLVKGTFGYLDPDYFSTGRLTRKSDVYAFGVVLFEVLCRKRAVDRSLDEEQWGLAPWAQDSIKEGRLKHIIDSDIRGQISPKCLKEFVGIAERCLLGRPKQRPTMAEVVVGLESVHALQEKTNNSLQAAGRTIFGRMLDMFPFPPNRENSGHGDSKLSSNSKGNNRSASSTVGADTNMFQETREVPADCRIPNPSLKVFTIADLERATSNFRLDFYLGMGGFGEVFLGWVDKTTFAPSRRGAGIAVAVKRYNHVRFQGRAEWLAEVSLFGRLAHPNIISLLGYCSDEHKCLLVYEYMQNPSFDRLLFANAPDIDEPLSWGMRLKIMIGVARGLTYLHSSKDQVIYCDVKSSNILLDQDFNAKLRDFEFDRYGPGIKHVSTRVVGYFGHLDPHDFMTGHLSAKIDIYSFGVVLLETLTGRRPVNIKQPVGQYALTSSGPLQETLTDLQAMDVKLDERHSLVKWVSPILAKRRELKKIMDPRLEQNYPLEGAFKYAALTLSCLAYEPKDRPSSKEVLQRLEQIYAINE